jgi:hypothetical protein
MNVQYIYDTHGKATGIFIPINEWQDFLKRYKDLQILEVKDEEELKSWQKEIIDQRLNDYYENPNDVIDFEITIANVRKML